MADAVRRIARRGFASTLAAVALALVLSAAGPVGAAERYAGSLFNPGNRVDAEGIVRDRYGQPVGRIEEDGGDGHALIDNDGRAVGRVEPGYSEGELVIRDAAGRRQGTLLRAREGSD